MFTHHGKMSHSASKASYHTTNGTECCSFIKARQKGLGEGNAIQLQQSLPACGLGDGAKDDEQEIYQV